MNRRSYQQPGMSFGHEALAVKNGAKPSMNRLQCRASHHSFHTVTPRELAESCTSCAGHGYTATLSGIPLAPSNDASVSIFDSARAIPPATPRGAKPPGNG